MYGSGTTTLITSNEEMNDIMKIVQTLGWIWKRMGFLMLPHPLTNFEIQKYYQNEPKFNGVYPRNNLPEKIKDGAYMINLDEYANVGAHCIALFCNRNEIVYFDSFGVEHVPKEIKKFMGNKNITANIFRVRANNSIASVCTAIWHH